MFLDYLVVLMIGRSENTFSTIFIAMLLNVSAEYSIFYVSGKLGLVKYSVDHIEGLKTGLQGCLLFSLTIFFFLARSSFLTQRSSLLL